MANVKWSDNSVFIPEVSLGATDYVMGITAGGVNAKFPGSVFPSAAGFVDLTTNQSVGGNKNFTGQTVLSQVNNPFVENITPTATITAYTTLTAAQLVSKELTFAPAADGTMTFPLGTDVDTILGTPVISGSINVGLKNIRLINTSAFTVSFAINTGVAFSGLSISGILILKPYSSMSVDLVKVGSGSFVMFGPSVSTGYAVIAVSGTTKTFAITDYQSLQNCSNAATQTLTVPPNASVPFPIGATIDICRAGAGAVTLTPGAGVTLLNELTEFSISNTNGIISCTQLTLNTWVVSGPVGP